jgi:hypothetical protein
MMATTNIINPGSFIYSFQVGDVNGYYTTGYTGGIVSYTTYGSGLPAVFTASFLATEFLGGVRSSSNMYVLREDGSNRYLYSVLGGFTQPGVNFGGGYIQMNNPLTSIRLITNGQAFTSGFANVWSYI